MAKTYQPKDAKTSQRQEKQGREPAWKRDRYEQRQAKAAIRAKHGSF